MEHQAGSLIPAAVAVLEVVLLVLPLPLILVANWHDAPPGGGSTRAASAARPPPRTPGPERLDPPESARATMARGAAFLGTTIWMLLAMVAAASILLALVTVAFAPPRRSSILYTLVMLLTGIAAAALISETVRTALARVLPIDPRSAVHATALVLTTALVGSQIANQLAFDVLSQQASTGAGLSPLDLVLQELPFLLAAALGVGLFIRRGPAATLDRLGLVRPTAWQLVLGLGAAFLFFAFGNGMDMLGQHISPGTARKVEAATRHLFGQLGNPVGIATIAVTAGICEEALFRGAMQPRLGILWTAIVFTTVHTQYGLSVDAVAVLVLAIGLGLLRRVANTTTSTVCHVVYNTLVGVGVSGVLLGPAVIAGAVLVAASAAAFFTGRLGSLRTAP